MSVTWGLDLSMTAVRLMRRDAGTWREDAAEPLDGPDMDTRLKTLAGRAEGPVDVFLPKDQILYTDIEIADLSNAKSEIEAAMDGRTPYALSEMRLDWDIDDEGTAHIAAIARETLEEAASFVRDLGVEVAGFGALAEPKDFPRVATFGRLDAPIVLETPTEPAPTFASARATAERAENEPVVRVDDARPVLATLKPDTAPLDPGIPVALPNSPPRVRTDVGAAVAHTRAQSLTAPPPVRVRQRDRAVPTPLLAGVAAALCVGIAAIIWAIFPNNTGSLPQPPAPVPETVTEDTTGAVAPEPQATAPAELTDTPPEAPLTDLALTAPAPSVLPETATTLDTAPAKTPPALDPSTLAVTPDLVPAMGAPRDPRPTTLAGIENTAPQSFRLAALPATPTAPSSLVPETITYPGAAITTPMDDASRAAPDATLGTEVAALPPAFVAPEPEVAEVEQADTLVVAETPAVEPPVDTEVADVPVEDALPDSDIADAAPSQEPVEPATEDIAALDPSTLETETTPVEESSTTLPTAPILTPTELAQSVPDTAPRARPGDFVTRVERNQYNGYTLAELAELEPPARPDSEQVAALLERASRSASELAVANSIVPRNKPGNFDTIVANALVQQQADQRAAALAANTPDTTAAIEAALAEELEDEEATSPRNSPRLSIPSSASVARQATIDDAIRLNRINLIGVYGSASERRALLRLSSGRFVKVKVGDRVDGGTVSAISASQLQYVKGSRTVSLSVPEG